ncbi:MAG: hypothetical protein F2881_02865 [Actinobacteria bacterium]|uniref:Unannotated protein n=1 Tax=freshwater metagenome TaxID=449393 RepID=A0A6J7P647_9ZZZZ|nr:hypothetical protein [Actinomycetota bacterium]
MNADGMFRRLNDHLDDAAGDEAPLTMSDILDLPDDQRGLARHVMRSLTPLTPDEAAAELDISTDDVMKIVGELSIKGILTIVDGKLKVASLARTTIQSPGGLWGKLGDF